MMLSCKSFQFRHQKMWFIFVSFKLLTESKSDDGLIFLLLLERLQIHVGVSLWGNVDWLSKIELFLTKMKILVADDVGQNTSKCAKIVAHYLSTTTTKVPLFIKEIEKPNREHYRVCPCLSQYCSTYIFIYKGQELLAKIATRVHH